MTEEEKLTNQKIREFRKRICDRENIRLMKLLNNIDIGIVCRIAIYVSLIFKTRNRENNF